MIEFISTDIVKDKTYLDEIISISSEAFKIPKSEYLNNLSKYKTLFFILLVEDNVIKAICKVSPDKDKNGCTMVGNVATGYEYRGRGYGKLLMKEVIRRYKTVSLNAVKVSTLMFYLKLGFKLKNFTLLEDLNKEEPEGDEYGIEGKWSLEYSNKFKKTLFLLGEIHNNQDNVMKIRRYIEFIKYVNPIVLPEIFEEDVPYYKGELKLRCSPLEDSNKVDKLKDKSLLESFIVRECGMMIKSITKALNDSNYVCVIVGDTHLRETVTHELGDTHIRNFVKRLSNVNTVIIRPEKDLREID